MLIATNKFLFLFIFFFRALEAFRKVLFLAPDFARLNEVHVRMGLMLKKARNLQEALKVIPLYYTYFASYCPTNHLKLCTECTLLSSNNNNIAAIFISTLQLLFSYTDTIIFMLHLLPIHVLIIMMNVHVEFL